MRPPPLSYPVPGPPAHQSPPPPATPPAFACPACGDGQIQELSVIYQSGTSVSVTKSRQSGLVLGPTWDSTLPVFGRGTDTAVRQSELARVAAPPPEPSWFAGAARKAQWAYARGVWERRWFCHRCGHVFAIDPPPPGGTSSGGWPPAAAGPHGYPLVLPAPAGGGSGVLTVIGWVATVLFGVVWLGMSATGPVFGLTVSAAVVAVVVAYLTAAPVRRSVDGVLANVRPGARLPSARLLVIFGLSLLTTVPRLVSRTSANSEVARLVAAAKDARADGRLEEAVELLDRAAMRFDADDGDAARDLRGRYAKELGLKREPEVALDHNPRPTQGLATSRASRHGTRTLTVAAVTERLSVLSEMRSLEKQVLAETDSNWTATGKQGVWWYDPSQAPGVWSVHLNSTGVLVQCWFTRQEVFSARYQLQKNLTVLTLKKIIEAVGDEVERDDEVSNLIVSNIHDGADQRRSGSFRYAHFQMAGKEAKLYSGPSEREPLPRDRFRQAYYYTAFAVDF